MKYMSFLHVSVPKVYLLTIFSLLFMVTFVFASPQEMTVEEVKALSRIQFDHQVKPVSQRLSQTRLSPKPKHTYGSVGFSMPGTGGS